MAGVSPGMAGFAKGFAGGLQGGLMAKQRKDQAEKQQRAQSAASLFSAIPRIKALGTSDEQVANANKIFDELAIALQAPADVIQAAKSLLISERGLEKKKAQMLADMVSLDTLGRELDSKKLVEYAQTFTPEELGIISQLRESFGRTPLSIAKTVSAQAEATVATATAPFAAPQAKATLEATQAQAVNIKAKKQDDTRTEVYQSRDRDIVTSTDMFGGKTINVDKQAITDSLKEIDDYAIGLHPDWSPAQVKGYTNRLVESVRKQPAYTGMLPREVRLPLLQILDEESGTSSEQLDSSVNALRQSLK